MNIRKVIREQIYKIMEQEQDDASLFGNTLDNIQTQLQTDLENVGTIIKTQDTDIKNLDNQIKSNLQLKGKLDAQNPHKKGLEREIPEYQKDYEKRKKQLKDLQDAKKGLEDAQAQINKQKMDLEKSTSQNKPGEENSPESSLPSLESPI
jgi:chromosome segregation ATPase